MSQSVELEAPEHFTAGAVGPPGERVFYLQARQGRRLVTLKCEKEQVGALGRYFASTLAKLPRAEGGPPAETALIEFAEPAWAVAAIGAGWDGDRDRFVVECKELLAEEAQEGAEQQTEQEPATARVWVTRAQAAAFVEQAEALMKAGRPICPMCSQPKDPAGHVCPRSNGHGILHVAS